uniref:Dynein light chain Tctex-type family member 5 n=1 Tax=Pseudonaja textilis TaxID=8673 RepID=A0A670YB75_PSETE
MIMKDKATHLAKNRGSVSSLGSHEIRAKDFFGRYKDSVSTVSYMDEHGHHEDSLRPAIQLENTYQLAEREAEKVGGGSFQSWGAAF